MNYIDVYGILQEDVKRIIGEELKIFKTLKKPCRDVNLDVLRDFMTEMAPSF